MMNEHLETAVSLLKDVARETEESNEKRLDVYIDPADVQTAVAALVESGWGYLAAITGVDLGEREENGGEIEILYHFCRGAAVLTLRLRVPYEDPVVDTVCNTIPSASFFERELSEMLGVTVRDTPNPARLFLPEDWPEDVYPLRKAYQPEAVAD